MDIADQALALDVSAMEAAREWGVSVTEARAYLEHVTNAGSFYASAVAFPYGNDGVMLAVSTAESTRKENEHVRMDRVNEAFDEPSWIFYEVWLYQNMNLLNFSGIHHHEHGGHCIGRLDAFLDRDFPHIQWRQKYLYTTGGAPIAPVCVPCSPTSARVCGWSWSLGHRIKVTAALTRMSASSSRVWRRLAIARGIC